MGKISKWLSQNHQGLSKQPTQKQVTGQWAENLALDYLQQQGLQLITRNFNCKLGEIDLIMQQQQDLIFVEVRYRKNNIYGSALDSVTYQKQQRIIRTAEVYLQRHYKRYPPCRYDVIAITGQTLEWIKNAFP